MREVKKEESNTLAMAFADNVMFWEKTEQEEQLQRWTKKFKELKLKVSRRIIPTS